MARGKNKAIAERRNQALEELGTAESQQNTIKKLTERVAELELELQTKEQLHKQAVAGMHYKLENNTSELVEELRGTVDSLREELGASEEAYKKIKKDWNKVFDGLRDHFMVEHKMKNVPALEAMMGILDRGDFIVDMTGAGTRHDMPREKLERLQKAQGLR